jgi:hypothetical protein
MKILGLIALIVIALGCSCIYLASPNQRWLVAPWPLRPARGIGALLLALGWWCLAQEMRSLTAIFVFVTALMLVFSVLPYLGALLGGGRRG